MSRIVDEHLNAAEKFKDVLNSIIEVKPRFKSKAKFLEYQEIENKKFEKKKRHRKIANASRIKNR